METMYTGLETDKFCETLPQILVHNMLIWQRVRGHKKYLKICQKSPKMAKMGIHVAATVLFQLHDKDS